MSSHFNRRREYAQAKGTARKLRRTIRDLYKRLVAETDPSTYYSVLTDIFSAQTQLNDLMPQINGWEKQGGCLPQSRTGRN